MKKTSLLIIIFLTLLANASHSQPIAKILLSCDSTFEKIDKYDIWINGTVAKESEAEPDGSLSKKIKLDEPGTYRFRIRACYENICGKFSNADTIVFSTNVISINKNNYRVVRIVEKYIER